MDEHSFTVKHALASPRPVSLQQTVSGAQEGVQSVELSQAWAGLVYALFMIYKG